MAEFRFKAEGVTGPQNPNANLENDIEFYNIKLQRAVDYVRIAHHSKLQEGWSVIDFRIGKNIKDRRAIVILARDSVIEKLEIPGGVLYAKDVHKYYSEAQQAEKREAKKIEKATRAAEAARIAELQVNSKKEELKRIMAAAAAELALLGE